ncbi:hypothetical protein KAR91_75765 [Candidatus Pacearchaeota archaeon]|nr:hypothetical protein [Candidatus Pacearchaeota archaeon]
MNKEWVKATFDVGQADYDDGEPMFGHAGIVDKGENGDIVVKHPCCKKGSNYGMDGNGKTYDN